MKRVRPYDEPSVTVSRPAAAAGPGPGLVPSRPALTTLLVFLAVALVSCSSDRARLGPADQGQNGFKLGSTTTYQVQADPGGSVPDSISGGTFVFPEGGSGTLKVARITKTPLAAPEGAEGFWAEYSGDQKLELRLARTSDSIPNLWVYGFGGVSTPQGAEAGDTWWPVMPEDTLSNPAVYQLVRPGFPDSAAAAVAARRGVSALLAPGGTQRPVHSYHFMRSIISPTTPEWLNLNNLKLVTKWTVQRLIDELPAGLKATAAGETAGRLAFRSYTALPSPNVSAYAAFLYYRTYLGSPYRRLYPMLSYVCSGSSIATEATVAHEVGHYFTHVFFGDDAFEALTKAQLREKHNVGSVHSERPMLEEYAMFADYFMNGSIRGGNDVEEPRPLLQKSAAVVNYPAQEGYACCLLARMHTSQDSIQNSFLDREDIPVIGASFADLFTILYSGKPATVNSLRAELTGYLAGKGQADRLPAILERTGWSYNGYGTVLDEHGKPVANAEVQSVCKVASQNGREYLAPPEAVLTNAKGEFTLPRIFPGTNTIRVKSGGLEQDFVYTADPNRRTDFADNLGPLVLEPTVMNTLRQLKKIQIVCQGKFAMDGVNVMYSMFNAYYGNRHEVLWTGNEFVWEYADSVDDGHEVYAETVRCSAGFSDTGRTLLRLQCHLVFTERASGGQNYLVRTTEDLDIDEIPLDRLISSELGTTAYFELTGAAIEPKLRSISWTRWQYNGTSSVVSFVWTDTEYPGTVGIMLMK